MYQPPHHREDRLEVQHALIRSHPLGTLVTLGASASSPIRFRSSSMPSRGQFGMLQGASGARQHSMARLRCEGRGAGRFSRAWRATSRRPGMRRSRMAERSCRRGTTPSCRPRSAAGRSRTATGLERQIGALTALAGRPARRAVGGERRARELTWSRRSKASSGSRFRSPASKASGRSARTVRRRIAAAWLKGCARSATKPARPWPSWCRSGERSRTADADSC